MDVESLMLALCTGFGLGFLLRVVRQSVQVVRLWVRGPRVMGVVTKGPANRPRAGLVVFTDHPGEPSASVHERTSRCAGCHPPVRACPSFTVAFGAAVRVSR